ncbi:MAG: replication protein [Oscillospiraceae bacterium]|nr:replication protein [Oscillospiraceae bacterium]
MANKDSRTRNWAVVLYPESAPEHWRDIIDDMHIEWVESPLHEYDTNPTGEVKKPHWHVLLMFGGVKSYDQVMEVIKPLNCPAPQKCHNTKSMVRYFVHLDNPDKFQYSVTDIIGHGGVEISDLLKPSAAERYTMIKEMCLYVAEHNILEFHALMDYAMSEEFDTWFPLLCDNSAYVVNQYIKSNRLRAQAEIMGAKAKEWNNEA